MVKLQRLYVMSSNLIDHLLKVHYVILKKELKLQNQIFIRNISFFHDKINKLFWEEYKFLRTLFKARNVAGSATYVQRKKVWNFVVL